MLPGHDASPLRREFKSLMRRAGAVFTDTTFFASLTGLLATSTDAGASAGPTAELYRNSATPAASDIIGEVLLTGKNSAATKFSYAGIVGAITDPTSASEDAQLKFRTAVAGTLADRIRLGAGLFTDGATGGDQGVNTINASQFFNDGVALPEGIASQADQEAGSSLVLAVTPGRQRFHPSAAKCWGSADFGGGLAASYGISSVTDVGVGQQTYTFSTAFTSASYGVQVTTEMDPGGSAATSAISYPGNSAKNAGSVQIITIAFNTFSVADVSRTSIACFGDN